MKKLLLCLFLCFFSLTSKAAVIDISSLNISGGNVLLSGSVNVALLQGDDPVIRMGEYQGIYTSTSITGSIVTGGDEIGTHFSGVTLPSDGINDYPAPSGTVDDVLGTITVDLRSWFTVELVPAEGVYNDGGIATGTYDAVTGAFSMSWDGFIENGTFPTPNTWTLTGTVTTVPLPAGVWLLLSGLIMFVPRLRSSK